VKINWKIEKFMQVFGFTGFKYLPMSISQVIAEFINRMKPEIYIQGKWK
jgi:hypothetical protein